MNAGQTTKETTPTVSAIVPAYNEKERIGRVLDVLNAYPGFREIIVVNDHSTDETERVVHQYPRVRCIRNQGQQGKGQAMAHGVRHTSGAVLFFCDADTTGLTHAGIDTILRPVLNGTADMSVAVRGRRVPWLTLLFARLFPLHTLIAGERAVRRQLWDRVPDAYKRGFAVESALNSVAASEGQRIAYRLLPDMRHTVKEQKYGFLAGTAQRWGMMREVARTQLALTVKRLRTTR